MEIINFLNKLLRKIVPRGSGAKLVIIGFSIVALIIFIAIFAPFLTSYNPTKSVGLSLQPPSIKHLMGTNRLGYDMFSRIVYGARTILIVVILSTIISLSIGLPLGLLSGYFSGIIDRILSIIMDSIYAFPGLILAIAVAAVIGPGVINTALAIAIVYIPTYYRMARGQTLSIREQLYIEAVKAIGAKDRTIMIKHILPNLLPTMTIVFSLSVADAILTEASLSFLGLGVTAPTPDWGYDLRAGKEFLPAGYWWLITFPGFFIILLTIGFSFIGEGLNEILNPRMKVRP
ncbi:MAG: ABC transporter permease [Nitrososphaerota archaeon]